MRATFLSASIVALVASAGAQAQSDIPLLIPPEPTISSPPDPTISSPPDATISSPATPTIGSPPAGISTPVRPTLSTPPLPSIRDSFPLPPFLTDPLGSMRSSLSTPSGSFSSFSSFGDQSSFLGRQGSGLTSASSGVSSSLLDSLSDPVDLFDLDPVSPAPSTAVGSSATLGGARPFPEFCQPEDFTCD